MTHPVKNGNEMTLCYKGQNIHFDGAKKWDVVYNELLVPTPFGGVMLRRKPEMTSKIKSFDTLASAKYFIDRELLNDKS